MNKCMFIGTLCMECELQESKGGKTYLTNSIAVSSVNGTDFFNITAWGKNAEVIAKYFNKGSKIGLETHAQQQRYEKNGLAQSTVCFLVDKIDFCEKKSSGSVEKNDSASDDLPFN